MLYNTRDIDRESAETITHKETNIRVFENSNEWLFLAPVFFEAGFDEEFSDIYQDADESSTLLGYVTLSMSKKTLHFMQRRTYQTSFIVAFTLAILIIATLFRISRRVTKPFEQLSSASW